MTEKKRFTIDNESDIIEFDYNTNEYIQDFIWADGKSWDKICNRLNELFDENEQLKKECYGNLDGLNYYQEQIGHLSNKISDLECVNEQLNAQKLNTKVDRDYFRTKASSLEEGYLQLQDKEIRLKKENEQLKQFKEDVFNKIDMHLRMLPTERDNEFNEDDGDPSLYTGAIYMLETLKKELEE